MNFYIVVEGPTEKKAYAKWIPSICQSLSQVAKFEDVLTNNFYIVQGGGYPNYVDIVRAAIADVAGSTAFDRLIICVDSEELTRAEKYTEIINVIESEGMTIDYRIVIQHYCFETWALGNRKIVARYPQGEKLKAFKAHFDVSTADPELLPVMPGDGRTRAQFAEVYLRALLNERFRNLSYIKGNPGPIAHESYFRQIAKRHTETGHLSSFGDLLGAFR